MINNIETTITALSTFPDRPNYTSARAYATAVATWLRENKELSETLATLIPELNLIIEQLNTTTENIETIEGNIEQIADAVLSLRNEALAFKNLAQKYANETEDIEVEEGNYSAKHWALKAYAAVATLPLGTLIDTLIGLDKTWSSTKINGELDLKADKNSTYTKEDVDTGFQEKLESGINLKTLNNQSLLGAGDISIITKKLLYSQTFNNILSLVKNNLPDYDEYEIILRLVQTTDNHSISLSVNNWTDVYSNGLTSYYGTISVNYSAKYALVPFSNQVVTTELKISLSRRGTFNSQGVDSTGRFIISSGFKATPNIAPITVLNFQSLKSFSGTCNIYGVKHV